MVCRFQIIILYSRYKVSDNTVVRRSSYPNPYKKDMTIHNDSQSISPSRRSLPVDMRVISRRVMRVVVRQRRMVCFMLIGLLGVLP